MRNSSLLMLMLVLAACGQVPGLDADVGAVDDAAPYPDILPVGALPAPTATRLTEDSEAEIDARRARLNQRANTL